MKQIKYKYHKYYINNEGYKNNLEIYYWQNGNIAVKINWDNGKRHGLCIDYNTIGKIDYHIYYL